MAVRPRLEALRQAVLGNARGREAEVTPDGQVVLKSDSGPNLGSQPEQDDQQPRVSKMSPHTFGGL